MSRDACLIGLGASLTLALLDVSEGDWMGTARLIVAAGCFIWGARAAQAGVTRMGGDGEAGSVAKP